MLRDDGIPCALHDNERMLKFAIIGARRIASTPATPVWVGLFFHLVDDLCPLSVVFRSQLLGAQSPCGGTITTTMEPKLMQSALLEIEQQVARKQTDDPLLAGRALLRLEALGLMTTGIVHDLGNIIQILSSTVDVLDQHPAIRTTKALRPTISRAVTSLESASSLIKQILNFARETDDRLESIDVAMCLARLEPLVRWIAKNNVRISMQIAPNVPAIVSNRSNLENALLNLALNARDSMPDGGVLSITAAPRTDGATVTGVALRVTDTGSGMTQETMARAFDPFFTTKANGRGTGLGLTMVRRFAQETGGSINIESKIGAGTTFILVLPLRPGAGQRSAL
jgi:signal transduction histidine kinase